MEDLLELVVSATASGCIYALVALAYLLILRPTSVINFRSANRPRPARSSGSPS